MQKPQYPPAWPASLKTQFDDLIGIAWGGDERGMRKDDTSATADVETEKAKILASIKRIAAANVVESWTARNGASQYAVSVHE